MVTESVECPAYRHIHTYLPPVKSLAIQYLPYPGLAAGHVDIQHHVVCAHDFEPALFNKSPELRGGLGIPHKERFHIGYLVEHKTVIRMVSQEVQSRQNMRQAHFQILFARLENSPLPVRVGNDPECCLGLIGIAL